MSAPALVDELIGHAAEAALSGLRVLPADLVLRRQVADLMALAVELLPGIETPQQLMFALDQMHARASRLVAIASLPACPSITEQGQMTTREVGHAARLVAAAVYALGVQGGRRGADPRLLAAAFDMSVEAAAAIVDEVAGR